MNRPHENHDMLLSAKTGRLTPAARLIRGKGLLGLRIDFAQGDAKLPGYASTVLVFRREERRQAVTPAQLSLDRAPDRLNRTRPALQLASSHGVAADAEGAG